VSEREPSQIPRRDALDDRAPARPRPGLGCGARTTQRARPRRKAKRSMSRRWAARTGRGRHRRSSANASVLVDILTLTFARARHAAACRWSTGPCSAPTERRPPNTADMGAVLVAPDPGTWSTTSSRTRRLTCARRGTGLSYFSRVTSRRGNSSEMTRTRTPTAYTQPGRRASPPPARIRTRSAWALAKPSPSPPMGTINSVSVSS
jgi:hypothetical protein